MRRAERTIFITAMDMDRLLRLLEGRREPNAIRPVRAPSRSTVCTLVKRVLDAAEVVPPARLPDNVVTLHARFRLRSADTGLVETAELLLPGEKRPGSRGIPIQTPLGRELLGRFVGETVRLEGRGGARVMEVAGILSGYDPAAAEGGAPQGAGP